MANRIVIGIDPDKRGALVIMNERAKILGLSAMPIMKIKDREVYDLGKIRQILVNWIRDFGVPTIVVVERPSPRPSQIVGADEKPCPECKRIGTPTGSLANWSRGYSQALFEMLCMGHNLRYALVPPKTWQAEVLRDVPHTYDTKAAALVVAKRLWPNQNWLATERSKKPHAGIVDAVLIGQFALRRLL